MTEHFNAGWRERVDDDLGSAEYASQCLRDELLRLNGAERLGEAFHELTHVQESLSDRTEESGG